MNNGCTGKPGEPTGRRDTQTNVQSSSPKKRAGWGRTVRNVLTSRTFVRRGLLTVFCGLCVFALSVGLLLPFSPSTRALVARKQSRPSVLLTSDGVELKRYAEGIKRPVSIDEISPYVVDALVATEDHRFHEHGGIDYIRLFGSVGRSLLGDVQGGSTLSMQLARNLYPDRIGNAPGLIRKQKEWITAVRLEEVYTKDEVIETYLNTMPFLYGVRGIEMAAQTYFSKSAADLTLTESATLIGMLKATSYYNPVRHPERAEHRRNVVLQQMRLRERISQEMYEKALAAPLVTRFKRPAIHSNPAPHFTAHVQPWLDKWIDRHGHDLKTEGLKIHTTLDSRLQNLARQAVARQGESLQAVADVEWSSRSNRLRSAAPSDYRGAQREIRPFSYFWESHPEILEDHLRQSAAYENHLVAGKSEEEALSAVKQNKELVAKVKARVSRLETGFAAIDPGSGKVRAWVGSRGFAQGPFDHVATARRQPGSTFKPFLYGAALQAGYEADDRFKDRTVTLNLGHGKTWQPASVGGTTEEWFTMKEALAHSKNTITAQIMADVGPRKVARFGTKMGIRDSKLRSVPSLALGTSEVTLLEMVSAYATIAAGGIYRPPLLVTHITNANGDTLAVFNEKEERVLDEEVAHTLADMMRGTVDYGTGQRIRSVFGIRCDVAGKTGTTQENADGWFLLMHPQLVGGSWVGFNDPRVTFRSDYWGQGSHNALYVVGDFYRHALRKGRISPNPHLAPYPEPETPQDMWWWIRTLVENRDREQRTRARIERRDAEERRTPARAQSQRNAEAEELSRKLRDAQDELESLLRRFDVEIDIKLEEHAERVIDGLRNRIEELESEWD